MTRIFTSRMSRPHVPSYTSPVRPSNDRYTPVSPAHTSSSRYPSRAAMTRPFVLTSMPQKPFSRPMRMISGKSLPTRGLAARDLHGAVGAHRIRDDVVHVGDLGQRGVSLARLGAHEAHGAVQVAVARDLDLQQRAAPLVAAARAAAVRARGRGGQGCSAAPSSGTRASAATGSARHRATCAWPASRGRGRCAPSTPRPRRRRTPRPAARPSSPGRAPWSCAAACAARPDRPPCSRSLPWRRSCYSWSMYWRGSCSSFGGVITWMPM